MIARETHPRRTYLENKLKLVKFDSFRNKSGDIFIVIRL